MDWRSDTYKRNVSGRIFTEYTKAASRVPFRAFESSNRVALPVCEEHAFIKVSTTVIPYKFVAVGKSD